MVDLFFNRKKKDAVFLDLCRDVLRGLGMENASEFSASGIEEAFRVPLVRESSDGMFRSNEEWLCAFMRSSKLDVKQIKNIQQAAIAAGVRYLLLVVFGSVTPEAETKLRESLAVEKIQVVLISGQLADILESDYKPNKQQSPSSKSPSSKGFSFARLRQSAQTKLEAASWRDRFQTISIQPMRIVPLHAEDAALAEADLFRALQGGSFLLLGEPGAGKTTSLLALAGQMALAGGYTPVFLPLGRYQGDFWDILCEALSPDGEPVSKEIAQKLTASGALTLLLDGINEVQSADLQTKLAGELNRLTSPNEPTSYSRWIISGRVHDYQQSRNRLSNLDSRRWEMQPLTADLIFRFLADALGKAQGLALYNSMGRVVRELCSNPLLLNMVLTICRKTGQSPAGRGAIYRQFIELMLQWGTERVSAEREALSALLPEQLTDELYLELAQKALTGLAACMPTTMIQWDKAQKQFAAALPKIQNREQAAASLLEDLTRRGILRRDMFNRISFFHHTFQEYFQARNLIKYATDDLIPKDGVPAARRESVVFLAGLLPDPSPLIKQAVEFDPALAFEMIRDAPNAITPYLVQELAKKLWERSLAGFGIYGANRIWAILFDRLAALLGKDAELLAAEVDCDLSQIQQTERLMRFYGELGDAQAQRRVLAKATSGEVVPQELLFAAAVAADDSHDYKRVVELYTQYLEKYPNTAPALNNRAIAYQMLGRKDEALKDYQLAVELENRPNHHANLADLLYRLGRKDEAFRHIRLSLEKDPTYASSHWRLGQWLEVEDPETALTHLEQAVNYAPHDEELRWYYPDLVTTPRRERRGFYGT